MNLSKFFGVSLALMMSSSLVSLAQAQENYTIKAGLLQCDVKGGVGLIFGSSKDVNCSYKHSSGRIEYYTGEIKKYGVDIGYTKSGVIIWGVIAGTEDIPVGALAGEFLGLSAEGSVGVGLGSNALVLSGGNAKIALQPLSIQGVEGVNLAGGIGTLELKPAN